MSFFSVNFLTIKSLIKIKLFIIKTNNIKNLTILNFLLIFDFVINFVFIDNKRLRKKIINKIKILNNTSYLINNIDE